MLCHCRLCSCYKYYCCSRMDHTPRVILRNSNKASRDKLDIVCSSDSVSSVVGFLFFCKHKDEGFCHNQIILPITGRHMLVILQYS